MHNNAWNYFKTLKQKHLPLIFKGKISLVTTQAIGLQGMKYIKLIYLLQVRRCAGEESKQSVVGVIVSRKSYMKMD